VTLSLKQARPVMCAATRFHSYQARRQFLEKTFNLRTRQAAADNDSLAAINSMNLEHILCQIKTYTCNIHFGFLLFDGWFATPSSLAQRCRKGQEESIPLAYRANPPEPSLP
jgi:hypothetical protein